MRTRWFLFGWFSALTVSVFLTTPVPLIEQHLLELWSKIHL